MKHFATALGSLAIVCSACGGQSSSDSSDAGTNQSIGGSSSTGGAHTTTGGAAPTGGAKAAGGIAATGSAKATGGIMNVGGASGGAIPTGGNQATGGGAASTGGAVGAGGVAASGGTSSVTPCDNNCTSAGFDCCNNACRNVLNDPNNCGQCGNICPSNAPVCQNGQCIFLPCTAELGPPDSVCCGQSWCAPGQLCCDIQGPLSGTGCLTPADGTCPRGCKQCVCANPDTPIATPDGSRAISELNVGDLVYSVDHDRVVAVPIIAVKRRRAQSHIVPQIMLENGQVLQISARHPTADGRTFGNLRAGDKLGELRIKAVELVTYEQPFTFDILPASDTGFYYAGGALIGSTLMSPPEPRMCEANSPHVQ